MNSKKPNILWLSHNVPYPPKTGVLQRNYNLLKEASKIGNIYLVAVFQKNILPFLPDMNEVHRELGKICKQIEIIYLPIDTSKFEWLKTALKSIFTKDPFGVNWIKSKGIQIKIQELVNSQKFDLVHFDTISLAYYKNLVGDIPKILNHHNIESHLMERRASIEKKIIFKKYYSMEAKKLKKFEQNNCKEFEINFTVSELDKETLLKISPGLKIEVIPNGVDTSYFDRNNQKPRNGELVFIGGMNWYPNKDAVLFLIHDLWPLIKESLPDANLTIVGADPPQELIKLCEEDSQVHAPGFVDDVRPYFINAQMYICPMRDGGGTRLKILDTFSMETALVSTTMGCEGIDVTNGENVLLADTKEEFLMQIKRIYSEPDTHEKLTKNGRKLIEEKYSWQVIGKKLEQVYSKMDKGN